MYGTLKLKKCYLTQSTVLISPILIYTALCCFLVLFSLPLFSYFLNSLFFFFFCFNFKGNLAPESAVLKLSGKDIGPFRGPVSSHLGFSSIFFAIDSTSRNARQPDFVVYRAIKITFGQGGCLYTEPVVYPGVEPRLLVRTRQYFSLPKKVLRRPA